MNFEGDYYIQSSILKKTICEERENENDVGFEFTPRESLSLRSSFSEHEIRTLEKQLQVEINQYTQGKRHLSSEIIDDFRKFLFEQKKKNLKDRLWAIREVLTRVDRRLLNYEEYSNVDLNQILKAQNNRTQQAMRKLEKHDKRKVNILQNIAKHARDQSRSYQKPLETLTTIQTELCKFKICVMDIRSKIEDVVKRLGDVTSNFKEKVYDEIGETLETILSEVQNLSKDTLVVEEGMETITKKGGSIRMRLGHLVRKKIARAHKIANDKVTKAEENAKKWKTEKNILSMKMNVARELYKEAKNRWSVKQEEERKRIEAEKQVIIDDLEETIEMLKERNIYLEDFAKESLRGEMSFESIDKEEKQRKTIQRMSKNIKSQNERIRRLSKKLREYEKKIKSQQQQQQQEKEKEKERRGDDNKTESADDDIEDEDYDIEKEFIRLTSPVVMRGEDEKMMLRTLRTTEIKPNPTTQMEEEEEGEDNHHTHFDSDFETFDPEEEEDDNDKHRKDGQSSSSSSSSASTDDAQKVKEEPGNNTYNISRPSIIKKVLMKELEKDKSFTSWEQDEDDDEEDDEEGSSDMFFPSSSSSSSKNGERKKMRKKRRKKLSSSSSSNNGKGRNRPSSSSSSSTATTTKTTHQSMRGGGARPSFRPPGKTLTPSPAQTPPSTRGRSSGRSSRPSSSSSHSTSRRKRMGTKQTSKDENLHQQQQQPLRREREREHENEEEEEEIEEQENGLMQRLRRNHDENIGKIINSKKRKQQRFQLPKIDTRPNNGRSRRRARKQEERQLHTISESSESSSSSTTKTTNNPRKQEPFPHLTSQGTPMGMQTPSSLADRCYGVGDESCISESMSTYSNNTPSQSINNNNNIQSKNLNNNSNKNKKKKKKKKRNQNRAQTPGAPYVMTMREERIDRLLYSNQKERVMKSRNLILSELTEKYFRPSSSSSSSTSSSSYDDDDNNNLNKNNKTATNERSSSDSKNKNSSITVKQFSTIIESLLKERDKLGYYVYVTHKRLRILLRYLNKLLLQKQDQNINSSDNNNSTSSSSSSGMNTNQEFIHMWCKLNQGVEKRISRLEKKKPQKRKYVTKNELLRSQMNAALENVTLERKFKENPYILTQSSVGVMAKIYQKFKFLKYRSRVGLSRSRGDNNNNGGGISGLLRNNHYHYLQNRSAGNRTLKKKIAIRSRNRSRYYSNVASLIRKRRPKTYHTRNSLLKFRQQQHQHRNYNNIYNRQQQQPQNHDEIIKRKLDYMRSKKKDILSSDGFKRIGVKKLTLKFGF